MDIGRLVKRLLLVAIVFAIWKYGLPLIGGRPQHRAVSRTDTSCVGSGMGASEAWGSGVGRFVNPPYDLDAWGTFSSGILSKVSGAEGACGDGSASSEKVRSAMSSLQSLVSELDTAIRNGSAPPEDAPQRQEAIDRQLDEASDLVHSGK